MSFKLRCVYGFETYAHIIALLFTKHYCCRYPSSAIIFPRLNNLLLEHFVVRTKIILSFLFFIYMKPVIASYCQAKACPVNLHNSRFGAKSGQSLINAFKLSRHFLFCSVSWSLAVLRQLPTACVSPSMRDCKSIRRTCPTQSHPFPSQLLRLNLKFELKTNSRPREMRNVKKGCYCT